MMKARRPKVTARDRIKRKIISEALAQSGGKAVVFGIPGLYREVARRGLDELEGREEAGRTHAGGRRGGRPQTLRDEQLAELAAASGARRRKIAQDLAEQHDGDVTVESILRAVRRYRSRR